MAREYLRRKRSDVRYTYRNRAFHATVLRYTFESVAQAQDLRPDAIPQSFGRGVVVALDILRPQNSAVEHVDGYADRTRSSIPSHLLPRFESFITTFRNANSVHNGSDDGPVELQTARLVAHRFRLGSEDIQLLLLLRKTGACHFQGTALERQQQMGVFHSRGPTAKSNFAVEGAIFYATPAKALPPHTYSSQLAKILDPYYNDRPFFNLPRATEASDRGQPVDE